LVLIFYAFWGFGACPKRENHGSYASTELFKNKARASNLKIITQQIKKQFSKASLN
jgi:hypothetical protein